jgi:hypothetical protein
VGQATVTDAAGSPLHCPVDQAVITKYDKGLTAGDVSAPVRS